MLSYEKYDQSTIKTTKLKPLGTIARIVFINGKFTYKQKIDEPTSHITVFAETSEGIRIQKDVKLSKVNYLPVVTSKSGGVYLRDYVDTLSDEERAERSLPSIAEDEIPF